MQAEERKPVKTKWNEDTATEKECKRKKTGMESIKLERKQNMKEMEKKEKVSLKSVNKERKEVIQERMERQLNDKERRMKRNKLVRELGMISKK